MERLKAIIAEMKQTYEESGEYYGVNLDTLISSLEKAVEEAEQGQFILTIKLPRRPNVTLEHVEY